MQTFSASHGDQPELEIQNTGLTRLRTARDTALGVLCALMIACGSGETSRSAWTDVTDSTEVRTVTRSASICGDCIAIEPIAVLGDSSGPGFLDWTDAVVQDSLGRFWVGQQGEVKVFDSSGAFLRSVGRPGEGPLEFARPRPIHADALGRVHILDPGNLRRTIVGADFTFREQHRIPATFHETVPLPAEDRFLFNSFVTTDEAIGLPLHVVEGAEIRRSFGASSGDERVMNPVRARRQLTVDRSGRVLAAEELEYRITAWTETGRRISGFQGPELNEFEVRTDQPFSDDNPIPGRIWDIRIDQDDRLWLLMSDARDDWLDNSVEEVLPNGEVVLRPRSESARSYLRGRIEVIDLKSASIVASARLDEVITAFVGDGVGLEMHHLEDGTPQLIVWRIGFDEPSAPRRKAAGGQ